MGTEPRLNRELAKQSATSANREIPPECYDFALMPEYLCLKQTMGLLDATGVPNPYFSVHERVTADTTMIGGRELISWATYNYLGMSGDPEIAEAAKVAVDKFGTSTSASRLVSGEKTVHVELERDRADGAEVRRDIITDLPIPTRYTERKFSVPVMCTDGNAIYLRLHDVFNALTAKRRTDIIIELPQLRQGVYVLHAASLEPVRFLLAIGG